METKCSYILLRGSSIFVTTGTHNYEEAAGCRGLIRRAQNRCQSSKDHVHAPSHAPKHPSLPICTSLRLHPPTHLTTPPCAPRVAESSSVKSISLPQPIPYSCWFWHVYGIVSESHKGLPSRTAAYSCACCALNKDT